MSHNGDQQKGRTERGKVSELRRTRPRQRQMMWQRSSVDGVAGSSATAARLRRTFLGRRPESSVLAYVSTDDAALDCGVCYLPLKPPIFQCEVGHVLCSPCRDKLAATGKCHVCGADTSTGGGHRRCHAMERVVESIRVPCPNAAYGCTATPAYCDRQGHLQEVCLHAPCHCPGEACRFAGTMEALLDHLAAAHGWRPRSAKVRNDEVSYAELNDGFNFFILDDDDKQSASATTAAATRNNKQFLILLDVASQPLGCAISVFLVHPHAFSDDHHPCFKRARCELTYSMSRSLGRRPPFFDPFAIVRPSRDLLLDHDHKSAILISCTDLSNGLPDPDKRFQFLVPNAVLTNKEKRDNAINVGFKLHVR